MAQLGNSTPSRRVPDLTVVEMRELRRRLQEANGEIERLRSIFQDLEGACHQASQSIHPNHVLQFVDRALDGGGGDNE